MSKKMLWAGACLLVVSGVLYAQEAEGKKAATSGQISRGKYLVERVGMCGDCHTPFSEQGQPIAQKHLQGAPLMFKPMVPVPGWVERSANIAGMKGWSDDEAIKFLTTGVDPNGKQAGPPMPQYRFNRSDAKAVLAYLRSLASEHNTAHSASK